MNNNHVPMIFFLCKKFCKKISFNSKRNYLSIGAKII
jgi:hypothetical protein